MALVPTIPSYWLGKQYRSVRPATSNLGHDVFHQSANTSPTQPGPAYKIGHRHPEGTNLFYYVPGTASGGQTIQVVVDETSANVIVSIEQSVNGIDYAMLPVPVQSVVLGPPGPGGRSNLLVNIQTHATWYLVYVQSAGSGGFIEVYAMEV